MTARLWRGRVVVVEGDVVHVRVAEVSWLSGSWVDYREDWFPPGERGLAIFGELPLAWFQSAGIVPEPRLPIELLRVDDVLTLTSTPRLR